MTAATHDAVAIRAYHIWEGEGRPHGRHEHHWLAAEAAASIGAAPVRADAPAAVTPVIEAAPAKAPAKAAAAAKAPAKAAPRKPAPKAPADAVVAASALAAPRAAAKGARGAR